MAHLLRGKQAGIKNDFSAGLDADSFAIDLVGLPQQLPYQPKAALLIGSDLTFV